MACTGDPPDVRRLDRRLQWLAMHMVYDVICAREYTDGEVMR